MANEKRLIDANALMKRFYNYYDCVNEFTSKNGYRGETLMDYEVADMIEDCIDNAPTVDAVEVVRCKDCMWFDTEDELADVFRQERHCFCTEMNNYVSENGFCSCGERKDNA